MNMSRVMSRFIVFFVNKDYEKYDSVYDRPINVLIIDDEYDRFS